MNSVDRHLTAESKAATLLAMRSAKKEILLIVEGDTDVDVFCFMLGIPRSNILSCDGKEVLMLVYGMRPSKGIDAGSIFIRDRDHDDVATCVTNGVLMIVTARYDVEMDLLANRIFGRIISDYLKEVLDEKRANAEFEKVCRPAAYLGALRLYSHKSSVYLDFDDIKYTKFIDARNLQVNIDEMVRYLFAKSKKSVADQKVVLADIEGTIESRKFDDIACSKDFIDILSIALHKHYRACPATECLPEVISRTLRISAINEDVRMMQMYTTLREHVVQSGFSWNGPVL